VADTNPWIEAAKDHAAIGAELRDPRIALGAAR